MIRRARLPIRSFTGVVISGGAVPGRVDNYVTIPKRDLVGATMVVVQRGRLHIAKGMPNGDPTFTAAALAKASWQSYFLLDYATYRLTPVTP